MTPPHEEIGTLDPNDWDELKKLMHEIVEDTFEHIRTVRDRAPWTPMPDEVEQEFEKGVPRAGIGARDAYIDFKENVLPYPMGNIHPKFWSWYMGNGTMMGAMAEYLTGIINPNAGAGNHVGQRLENQVIEWMKSLIGYPDQASGLLTSGGSMANFVALATARHAKSNFDIRKEGLVNGGKQMTIYASTEVHNCNDRAIELLGIGSNYLRKIPVHDDFTINLTALESTIQEDIANGLQPICIIGSAGTVNTGSIDDLPGLAKIAQQYNLWYHIDGAIGAIAVISETVRPMLDGIDLADSVALDLHKWLHIPFEAGCVLIKERQQHRDTFAMTSEYLVKNKRGLASGSNWFSEYGLQLSRRLNALKIWMSIKEQGIDRYGQMITKNVNQAHYLGRLVAEHNHLELLAPIVLDIVCYRYNPGHLSQKKLNELNENILAEMHLAGIAVPSYTTLKGNYCIRVAIANHRSTFEDFTELAHATVAIGHKLLRSS